MAEQLMMRVPENLKKQLRKHASEKGLTLNAFLLDIIWNWLEEHKEV